MTAATTLTAESYEQLVSDLRGRVIVAVDYFVLMGGEEGADLDEWDCGHSVAKAAGRRVGRPVAHPDEKIEHAQFLAAQGASLGTISTKTGIPKTSLHRYLAQGRTDRE